MLRLPGITPRPLSSSSCEDRPLRHPAEHKVYQQAGWNSLRQPGGRDGGGSGSEESQTTSCGSTAALAYRGFEYIP